MGNCTNSLIFSLALHLAIGYHKRDEKMDGYISSRIGSPSSKKLSAVVVIISYSFDYVILLVLIIAFYLLDKAEPFHQPFSLKNYSLMYQYEEKERITIQMAIVLVCVVPALLIGLYTTVIDGFFATGGGSYKKYPLKSRFWELNCGILGLLLSIGSTFVVTQILKNAIGKPRPDIIDRCNIPPEIAAPFLERANFTLVTLVLPLQGYGTCLSTSWASYMFSIHEARCGRCGSCSIVSSGAYHRLKNHGCAPPSLRRYFRQYTRYCLCMGSLQTVLPLPE